MSSVARGLAIIGRDLVAVYMLTVAAIVTSSLGPAGTVWLPLTILLLLVLPGYVTTAFAYAGAGRDSSGIMSWTPVTLLKRTAFTLGGSLMILPLLAIVTYLSPLMLTPAALVIVVSGYVFIVALATGVRRGAQSGTFRLTSGSGPTKGKQTVASMVRASRQLNLPNAVLAVSVLFAAGALGVAVAVPSQGSTSTDLHLLTEQNGRLVANDYPANLAAGESASLTVGVTNEEHQRVEYTVVAELQRVQISGQSVDVVDRQSVGRYMDSLEHGETWRQQLNVRGSMSGENLRLAVYLYRGDAPETPTSDSAYRTTNIWLDVGPSG